MGATLWVLRVQAMESGSELTASFAHRMEEQTSGALQSVDHSLQLGANGMAQLAATGSLKVASANALMREQIKGLPFVRALWVVNAQGRIVYDSAFEAVGLETGDRDYFTIYRTQPLTGFQFGAPVQSRRSGKWIMTAKRPLHAPDGSFAGIIVAAVSPHLVRYAVGNNWPGRGQLGRADAS